MLVQQVSHSDAETAAAALEAFWPGVVLGAATGSVYFGMSGYASGYGLAYIEVALDGQHMSTRLKETAGFMVTIADSLDGGMVDSGAEIDHGQPYVTRAGLRSEYASARCRTVSVDERLVDTYLRDHAGNVPKGGFRFTGTAPKTQRHAATWRSLTTTVASAMRTGLADDPMLGPVFANTVAASSVACFPSNWVEVEEVGGVRSTAAVRRAKVFIEEHAPEPITVGDVARAARLSVRGLQNAFQSQEGLSPMAYLRRVRLELARTSLLEADPSDPTRVAAIARAAGFAHLSRFAASYRAVHGENPRDTLRR